MSPKAKSAIKTGTSLALAVVVLPLLYTAARKFASKDLFGRHGANWTDPFGKNIGSVMDDVDIKVYNGSDKLVSLHADKIEVRRDKVFMDLLNVSDGKIYEKGKPTAFFAAMNAEYDMSNERLVVDRGASLKSTTYDLNAPNLHLDVKTKTVEAKKGIKGTFEGGKLAADFLKLNFGGRTSSAKNVSWKGAAKLPTTQQVRDLQIRSREVEYTADPDIQVYHDAEASDRDSLMRTKKLTWNRDTDTITMEGACEYYGPEAILVAPKVVVFRKEKRAVATGDVRLLVKPERQKGVVPPSAVPPAQPVLPEGLRQPPVQGPREIDEELRSGKTARKYPVVVTCEKVEYTYAKGRKQAIITGSPRARQQMRAGSWREITGPKAIYEEEKEILTILSTDGGRDVRMKNSAGDDLMAQKLVISTTEGKEKMTGTLIEGVMKVRDDELDREGGGG